jgi:hypothetical protein
MAGHQARSAVWCKMPRPSTSFLRRRQDVDARHKLALGPAKGRTRVAARHVSAKMPYSLSTASKAMNAGPPDMPDRFRPHAAALAAAVLLIALDGMGAVAQAQTKRHDAPKGPPREFDAPWAYVHCAANGYVFGNPCELDPAMQRMNGGPLPYRPRRALPPDAEDQPRFAPSR